MPEDANTPGSPLTSPSGARAIAEAATAVAAFVGRAVSGPADAAVGVAALAEYEKTFGCVSTDYSMGYAVRDFFQNGGGQAVIVRLGTGAVLRPQDYLGDQAGKTGIYRLEEAAGFNILCIPPDRIGGDTDPAVWAAALAYCVARRAMLVVDPPGRWGEEWKQGNLAAIRPADLGLSGVATRNAAVYFPRIMEDIGDGRRAALSPCGAVAGIWARTDASAGVWKAPAGIETGLAGAAAPECNVTDAQNAQLNRAGINCLRSFPSYGAVVWGGRTAWSAQSQDEYEYVSVRRLLLFVEQSVAAGMTWAVFEPNDETLWSEVRLEVEAFLAQLERQGAFYSHWVMCDRTTTTPDDILNGTLNVDIGLAPLQPAEFVVLRIALAMGQGG